MLRARLSKLSGGDVTSDWDGKDGKAKYYEDDEGYINKDCGGRSCKGGKIGHVNLHGKGHKLSANGNSTIRSVYGGKGTEINVRMLLLI